MPDKRLNRSLIGTAIGLGAVIIIGLAIVATRQDPGSQPESAPESAAAPSAPSAKSDFGDIAWHESPIPAPATIFKNAADEDITLADFAGKVLVVNFWATWCAPCIKEMPTLDALQAKLGGPDFEVLVISQDREGASVAEPFMAKNEWSNLALYTEAGNRFGRDANLRGLPTTLIIGKDGNEHGRVEGDTDWNSPEIEEQLRALMGAG